jgi:hypothetical protein
MNQVKQRVGIMMDTESLGLRPSSIVTEIAFIAFDLDDPETILKEVEEFLPLEPQQLVMNRTIDMQWLTGYFINQPAEIQERIRKCEGADLDELLALVRSVIRKFNQVTENGNLEYEVWFRRPQHDVPLLESLFAGCGERLPWAYDTVNDVATLLNRAGINPDDIAATGPKHVALNDCRHQLACYVAARLPNV